jgi:hypothetical protein
MLAVEKIKEKVEVIIARAFELRQKINECSPD